MEHSDFKVGAKFWTATGAWVCTDVGTRTIVAVDLYEDDRDDIAGRAATVFDTDDWLGCHATPEEFKKKYGFEPPKRGGSAFTSHSGIDNNAS